MLPSSGVGLWSIVFLIKPGRHKPLIPLFRKLRTRAKREACDGPGWEAPQVCPSAGQPHADGARVQQGKPHTDWGVGDRLSPRCKAAAGAGYEGWIEGDEDVSTRAAD